MALFGQRKPLTREQIRAINAKQRIGGIKQNIKELRQNRIQIEDKLRLNNQGQLSPQEQAVIVTSHQSAQLTKDNFQPLPIGNRDEQVSIILEQQREKLIKKEGDLEFQKGKLELESKI